MVVETVNGRPRRFPRGAPFALAAAVLIPVCLGGCGSSGPPATLSPLNESCAQVAAVLSDGPDPGADPVGYAAAQVLPLRQIHTASHALGQAIDRLAAAYHTVAVDNGGVRSAKRGVAAASAAIDAICPGAAS